MLSIGWAYVSLSSRGLSEAKAEALSFSTLWTTLGIQYNGIEVLKINYWFFKLLSGGCHSTDAEKGRETERNRETEREIKRQRDREI
jgi:hypothetical protein